MSQNFSYPPGFASLTISAEGANGSPIPSESLLVAGKDGSGNLQPLSVSASGILNVSAVSLPLPAGAATSANQVSMLARLSGSLVPAAYDEIDLTYVPSGNGAGQIQTAVYKLASATVKTVTMTYDSSDRLSTAIAS